MSKNLFLQDQIEIFIWCLVDYFSSPALSNYIPESKILELQKTVATFSNLEKIEFLEKYFSEIRVDLVTALKNLRSVLFSGGMTVSPSLSSDFHNYLTNLNSKMMVKQLVGSFVWLGLTNLKPLEQ